MTVCGFLISTFCILKFMNTELARHEYYLANKEKIKKYYLANKEKYQVKQRKYYQLNKKTILARMNDPQIKAKAKIKAKIRRKIKYNRAWFSDKYRRLRSNAKIRNKIFNLSFEEFVLIRMSKTCLYCGRTAEELITKDKIVRREVMTIDRINNNKGYSKENCVLACYDCNRIKGNRFSYNEMILIGNLFNKIYKTRK